MSLLPIVGAVFHDYCNDNADSWQISEYQSPIGCLSVWHSSIMAIRTLDGAFYLPSSVFRPSFWLSLSRCFQIVLAILLQ